MSKIKLFTLINNLNLIITNLHGFEIYSLIITTITLCCFCNNMVVSNYDEVIIYMAKYKQGNK